MRAQAIASMLAVVSWIMTDHTLGTGQCDSHDHARALSESIQLPHLPARV